MHSDLGISSIGNLSIFAILVYIASKDAASDIFRPIWIKLDFLFICYLVVEDIV